MLVGSCGMLMLVLVCLQKCISFNGYSALQGRDLSNIRACTFAASTTMQGVSVMVGGLHSNNKPSSKVYMLKQDEYSLIRLQNDTPVVSRFLHTVNGFALGKKKLFVVFGGLPSSSPDAKPLKTAQIFEISGTTAKWRPCEIFQFPGLYAHASTVVDTTLYIFGGRMGREGYYSNSLYSYDLCSNVFKELTNLTKQTKPAPRAGHVMIYCANVSSFVIFGGHNRIGMLDDMFFLDKNTFVFTKVTVIGPSPTVRNF